MARRRAVNGYDYSTTTFYEVKLMLQPTSIYLSKVVCDPNLQPRVDGLDTDHVHELEANPACWPPLKVVQQGGSYVLVDGFHRYAAAQNLELAEVAVEVLESPPDNDLVSLAFALNAAHGKPLTLSDRRAFAGRLLCQHADLSDREIGRRAGLVQPTIAKIRRELEQQATIRPTETRKGRDGHNYPAQQTSRVPLTDVISSIASTFERLTTPAERMAQRDASRYLSRLVGVLEERGSLTALATVDTAVDACRDVLGNEKAAELGARLGESARTIVAIADALVTQPNEQATS